MEEMNIFGERMFKKSLILSKVVFCLFVCLSNHTKALL